MCFKYKSFLTTFFFDNREDGVHSLVFLVVRHRKWGRPPRDAGDGLAQASGMVAGVQKKTRMWVSGCWTWEETGAARARRSTGRWRMAWQRRAAGRPRQRSMPGSGVGEPATHYHFL